MTSKISKINLLNKKKKMNKEYIDILNNFKNKLSKNLFNLNNTDILNNFIQKKKIKEIFSNELDLYNNIIENTEKIALYLYPNTSQWKNDVINLIDNQINIQKNIKELLEDILEEADNLLVQVTSISVNKQQNIDISCSKILRLYETITTTNKTLLNDITYAIPLNIIQNFGNKLVLSKNVQISASGIYDTETSNNLLEKEANQSSIETYNLINANIENNNIFLYDNLIFNNNNVSTENPGGFEKSVNNGWFKLTNYTKMEYILNSTQNLKLSNKTNENYFFLFPESLNISIVQENLVKIEDNNNINFIITSSGYIVNTDLSIYLNNFRIKKSFIDNLIILNNMQNFYIENNNIIKKKIISNFNTVEYKVNIYIEYIENIIDNKISALNDELEEIPLQIALIVNSIY